MGDGEFTVTELWVVRKDGTMVLVSWYGWIDD